MKQIEWDGKQISKPGLYSKIGIDTYHKGDICIGHSVSSSGLRLLRRKSPAHFYCEWPGNPNHIEQIEKASFILGRAAHHLFLAEVLPSFDMLFAAQPEEYPDAKTGELKKWTYAAQYCKDWRSDVEAQGKSILTPEMIKSIRGMADALWQNSLIKQGALNGLIERSIFWQDKPTGLWIKVRPDNIPTSGTEFIDFKTTTSVVWTDLTNTIASFGYNQQGALIRRAAREVLDIDNPTFHLVFAEKTPPYCVETVTMKDHDLDLGEKLNRRCLDMIARCLETNRWPGPGGDREDARYIELPEWARKQSEDWLTFAI